jgi:hypothetical protein
MLRRQHRELRQALCITGANGHSRPNRIANRHIIRGFFRPVLLICGMEQGAWSREHGAGSTHRAKQVPELEERATGHGERCTKVEVNGTVAQCTTEKTAKIQYYSSPHPTHTG